MTSIDETPPRSAVAATTGVAGLAALAVSLVPGAALLGVVGVGTIAVGTDRGSRLVLGVGSLLQFAGILLAGIASLSPGLVLFGLVAAVLAWDVGEQSINVAGQLGRNARIQRPIAIHAAASALVGATALGGVYLTYLSATGGQPLAALLLLVAGAATVMLAMQL